MAVDMPYARSLPALIWGSTGVMPSSPNGTWPPTTSVTAWPPPLYGICVICVRGGWGGATPGRRGGGGPLRGGGWVFVWSVGYVWGGELIEHLAGQMLAGAVAGGGVAQDPGIFSGGGQQSLQGRRQGRRHRAHEHHRPPGEDGERRHFLADLRPGDMRQRRAGDAHQGQSVLGRFGSGLQRDRACGTRPVLDDHGLIQLVRQRARNDAGQDIRGAAGRLPDQPGDGPTPRVDGPTLHRTLRPKPGRGGSAEGGQCAPT